MVSPWKAKTLFPPIPEEEEEKKEYIIPSSLITQGRIQFENERSTNLVPLEPEPKTASYGSIGDAMHGVGSELGNSNIAKDDAWWKRTLRALDAPLTALGYMDIPIELLAEATIDPLSMLTGKQLSPLRGSADREHFEAWKGLFGADTSTATGWGELKSRLDIASGAFEKRPLKMQLGLGAIQIAATLGAGKVGVAAAGIRALPIGARLLRQAGKIGLRSLDPFDVVVGSTWKGAKAGWSVSRKQKLEMSKASPDLGVVDYGKLNEDLDDVDMALDKYVDRHGVERTIGVAGGAPSEPTPIWRMTEEEELRELLVTTSEQRNAQMSSVVFPENPLFGMPKDSPQLQIDPEFSAKMPKDLPGYISGLTPTMMESNEFGRLFHDLAKFDNEFDNITDLERKRDLAILHTQKAAAWRPGAIARVTVQDLKDVLKSARPTQARLTVRDGSVLKERGTTVDLLSPIKSKIVIQNYLDELAKPENVGKLKDDLAFVTKDHKGSVAGLPQSILQKYKALGYNLGQDAANIRSLAATEEYLTGRTAYEIQKILGHKSIHVTVGYIREWALDHTDVVENFRSGLDEIENLPKESLAAIKSKVKILRDERSRITKIEKSDSKEIKNAKSMMVAGAEFDALIDEIGFTYRQLFFRDDGMPTELAQRHLDMRDWEAVKRLIEDRTIGQLGSVGTDALEELFSLDIMRKIAAKGRAAHESLLIKKMGLAKPHRGQPKKLAPGHGILNRAGFEVYADASSGHIDAKLSDVVIKDGFNGPKYRQNLAEEMGVNWTDDQWKAWGKVQVKEYNEVIDAMRSPDKFADSMKYIKTEMKRRGKSQGGKLYEILETYVDRQAMWAVDDYSRIFQYGGPLDKLADELKYIGSGSGRGILVEQQKWDGAWNKVRNTYEATVQESAHLDLKVRVGAKGLGTPSVGFMDKSPSQQNIAVQRWLGSPEVRRVLAGRRFRADMSEEALVNKLYTLSKARPKLFGNGFNELATHEKEEYLDKLAGIMYNPTANEGASPLLRLHLGEVQQDGTPWMPRHERDVDPTRGLRPRDKSVESIDGIDTSQVVGDGAIPEHHLTIPNINYGAKAHKFNNWWNTTNWIKPIKPFVEPVGQFIYGGSAPFARDVTKIISVRAQRYRKVDDVVGDTIRMIRHVMTKSHLNLQASPLDMENPLHIQAAKEGITEGNQSFKGLEDIVRPLDEIRETERTWDRVEGGYDLNTLKRIDGHIAAGRAQGNALTNLTQVDVILDRIHPDDWDKYFDFTKSGGDDMLKGLKFLKDTIDEMDEIAVKRGVKILEKIKDKGGEYLANYFPRMYKTQSIERLKKRDDMFAPLSSFAGFYMKREQEDILRNITADPKVLGATQSDTVSALTGASRMFQEDVAQRVGQYVETMWKEIIDHEAEQALKKHQGYLKGSIKGYREAGERATEIIGRAGSKFDLQRRHEEVQALESTLNRRLEGLDSLPAETRLIEQSTSPEINHFYQHITATDNDAGVVRKYAQDNEVVLRKLIQEEKSHITKGYDRMTQQFKGGDWAQATFNNFSAEDQKAIRSMLAISDHWAAKPAVMLAKAAKKPTQLLRTFKSGFDFGAGLIHGFNSLVRIPLPGTGISQNAWYQGQKAQLDFFARPEHYDKWRLENVEDIQLWMPVIRIGDAEPVRYMDADEVYQNFKRTLTNLPGIAGVAMSKLQLANRFETGFTGLLDVMRMELIKAREIGLRNELAKQGHDLYKTNTSTGRRALNLEDSIVRAKVHEFAATLNKATGVYDTHLSQLTPTQSFLESSLLFFAPTYRRSTYGIMADIFRGGMRRREALQTLTGVVMAGMAAAAIAKFAFGNEDAMSLEESYKFGKFDIAGTRVGIGTAWWTAFRTAADIALLTYEDPEKLITGEDMKEHPLYTIFKRRGRSQLAPTASLATDIISGKTFIGEPLRDPEGDYDYSGLVSHLGRSAIPFWLDGAFAGGWSGAGIAMPAEMLGLQAYAIQDYDKLAIAQQYALETWDDKDGRISDWRKAQVEAGQRVSWAKLPEIYKDLVIDRNPMVNTLHEEYKGVHTELARGSARDFVEYNKQRMQNELVAVREIAKFERAFEKGEISGRQFIEVVGNQSAFRRNSNTALLEGTYQGVALKLLELRAGRDQTDKIFQGDILYDDWMHNVVFHPDNTDSEQMYLYDVKRRNEAVWRTNHGLTDDNHPMWQYMQERKNSWLQHSPLMREILDTRELLKPYWTVHDSIWAVGTEMNEMATDFMQATDTRKGELTREDSRYIQIRRAIEKGREQLRDRNIEMDWMLVKYYEATPRHRETLLMRDDWRNLQYLKQQDNSLIQSPHYDDLEVSLGGRVTNKRDKLLLTGVY